MYPDLEDLAHLTSHAIPLLQMEAVLHESLLLRMAEGRQSATVMRLKSLPVVSLEELQDLKMVMATVQIL